MSRYKFMTVTLSNDDLRISNVLKMILKDLKTNALNTVHAPGN